MDGHSQLADGQLLSSNHDSLAFGVPRSAPGAIYALAIGGGFAVGPREGRTVGFGRNKPEVHICIGEDDRRVSRQHGLLTCQHGQWWASNTGRLPIRLPGSQWLFSNEESLPLAAGYTPLFVPGTLVPPDLRLLDEVDDIDDVDEVADR